jgi:small subunit ribosomal protein S1
MSKIRMGGDPTVDSAFDWNLYEHSTRSLTPNAAVKRRSGDDGAKVYCHEQYAQALYDATFDNLLRFSPPEPGRAVSARVVGVKDGVARVDIGWREDALVDLRKESDDAVEQLTVGNELDVLLEAADLLSGKPVHASHTKLLLKRVKDDLMESVGKRVAFHGVVESMIENAGYLVDVQGIRCFMPGSLAGMNKLVDFSSIVGSGMYIVPINYSHDRDCVVVSHREYLKALVPGEMAKIKEGDQHTGFVTGTSHHGIFVEFNGCLTGLVSQGDLLPETRDALLRGEIRPGQEFEFYVKELVESRIVLSEKPVEPSPWETVDTRLKLNSSVTGTIKRITRFGLFVEVAPRLVGLLHRSYLDDSDVFEVGQEIEATVVKIDKQARRIDLAV